MNTEQILFALLRGVICGERISEQVKAACTPQMLEDVYTLAAKHDLAHLVGQAVSKLGLPDSEIQTKCKKAAMSAFVRYMRLDQAYRKVCRALEEAEISFIPLKGAVLQAYYPDAWMRTSCDVDVLVHREDLDQAVALLMQQLSCTQIDRATHDVTLLYPGGVHIELHFDLVEEGRANFANPVLESVWKDVRLREGHSCWYEMSDAFFYFYHIAHMAKHLETGGCGIRPFIDLWILDGIAAADKDRRDMLLRKGDLLQFANAARKLSRVWLGGEDADPISKKMQEYILHGGAYGSTGNRVALQQRKKGGRIGYLFSRVFIPYTRLKRYYPVLEKHPWLTPFMQVRRWFMLLKPDVAQMARSELSANSSMERTKADEMQKFLDEIGIHLY